MTILIHADKTPNSAGAIEVGITPEDPTGSSAGMLEEMRDGTIKAVYLIDDALACDPAALEALAKVDFLVVHASNESAPTDLADVVLAFLNVRGKKRHNGQLPGICSADTTRRGDAGTRAVARRFFYEPA